MKNFLALVGAIFLATVLWRDVATGFQVVERVWPTLRGSLDPIGVATEKIQAAHAMLMTQENVDVMQFPTLLATAYRTAPGLHRQIAAEWRRDALLTATNGDPSYAMAKLHAAIEIDPGVARDDTVRQLCYILDAYPSNMPKELRVPPKSVESAKSPPDGILRPVSSNFLMHPERAPMDGWPKVLRTVPPQDPRGPNAPEAKVTLLVQIEQDGHFSSLSVFSGPDELRRAAAYAGYQWTYSPLMVFGRPVGSVVKVDVSFGGGRSPAR